MFTTEGAASGSTMLAGEQRERLTVLAATWGSLQPFEVDGLDVVRAAHWVLTGRELEVAGWPPKTPTEYVVDPDAATWRAPVAGS